MSGHADTIRVVLNWPITRFNAVEHQDALAALDALLAENQRLRDALGVYADARHWALSRDDLNYKVVSWIGPGAEKNGLPDAMQVAREALAGDTG